jgi:ferredoxin
MASIALLLIYHDDGFVMNDAIIVRRRAIESSCSYSSYNNNYNDQDIPLKRSRRSRRSRRSYGGGGGVMTMNVAPFKRPRAQNVPGNLYVDESCIDCDACRWICPSVFNRYTVSLSISHSFYVYIYMYDDDDDDDDDDDEGIYDSDDEVMIIMYYFYCFYCCCCI